MKNGAYCFLPLVLVLTVCSATAIQAQAPTLLYQGHASMRITTPEGKVIYIDPYQRVQIGYEAAADVILITDTRHFDHNHLPSVKNRNRDCVIITPQEAIENGGYRIFDLEYVTIETVEAGYNALHDTANCVGYILTFSNNAALYVSGDTSQTPQMTSLAGRNLDYAFFCCDGIYTMTMEEAISAARTVRAKRSLPYHTSVNSLFDRTIAEQFAVDGRIITAPGEELLLELINR
jgi:L-ascorbate metabolism protein UlaG (beta-lactamase superfamily)